MKSRGLDTRFQPDVNFDAAVKRLAPKQRHAVGWSRLFNSVNQEALDRQARAVIEDKYFQKAGRTLSHPLLARRYARLQDGAAMQLPQTIRAGFDQ